EPHREGPDARPVERRRGGDRDRRNQEERQRKEDSDTSNLPMMTHPGWERRYARGTQDEGGSRSPRPFLRAAVFARRKRRLLSPSCPSPFCSEVPFRSDCEGTIARNAGIGSGSNAGSWSGSGSRSASSSISRTPWRSARRSASSLAARSSAA